MASTVKSISRIQETIGDDGRVIEGYMTAVTVDTGVETVVTIQYGPDRAPSTLADRESLLVAAADTGAYIVP